MLIAYDIWNFLQNCPTFYKIVITLIVITWLNEIFKFYSQFEKHFY